MLYEKEVEWGEEVIEYVGGKRRIFRGSMPLTI